MGPFKPRAGVLALATIGLALAARPASPQASPTGPDSGVNARPHHIYLIGSLRVSQAWIDADGVADGQAPAYLVVENRSGAPEHLTAASLAGASSVSLDGRSEDTADAIGLVVPANGTLVLKPGAAHLELHGVQGLQKGNVVSGTVRFERSGLLHLSFLTDRAQAASDDQTSPIDRKPVDLER